MGTEVCVAAGPPSNKITQIKTEVWVGFPPKDGHCVLMMPQLFPGVRAEDPRVTGRAGCGEANIFPRSTCRLLPPGSLAVPMELLLSSGLSGHLTSPCWLLAVSPGGVVGFLFCFLSSSFFV